MRLAAPAGGRGAPALMLESRRVLVLAAAAAATAGFGGSTSASASTRKRCTTESNPSTTTVTCQNFGVLPDGRLNGCASDEPCVSTSAISNPSKYGPPWRPPRVSPEASDVARAWRAVVSAVTEQEGLKIAEQDDARRYLRAVGVAAYPPYGVDDVEFLLRGGGDESSPDLLYRSATRQSVFVYPLQQPVNNQKSHAERLAAIRGRLGWEEAGLPTDSGAELAAEMLTRFDVPVVDRFFGLEIRGMRVPE